MKHTLHKRLGALLLSLCLTSGLLSTAALAAEADADTLHSHDVSVACGSDAPEEFTPWESADSLPTEEGAYYLTTDVDLSRAETETTWEVGEGVYIALCLNGHKVDLGPNTATVAANSCLEICDCQEKVNQDWARIRGDSQDGVLLAVEGEMYLHSGNLTKSVSIAKGGEFQVLGGALTGQYYNVIVEQGGELYLSGQPYLLSQQLANVAVRGNQPYTPVISPNGYDGAFLGNFAGRPVRVMDMDGTLPDGAEIVMDVTDATADLFEAAGGENILFRGRRRDDDDNKLYLCRLVGELSWESPTESGTMPISAFQMQTYYNLVPEGTTATTFTLNKDAELAAAAISHPMTIQSKAGERFTLGWGDRAYSYYLSLLSNGALTLRNVTLDGTYHVTPPYTSETPYFIDGRGKSVTLEEGAVIQNAGTVLPPAAPAQEPTLLLMDDYEAGGVKATNLTIQAGAAIRNNVGGGVSGTENLTMTGGEISGNLSTGYGGAGVYIEAGEGSTITGGAIRDNISWGEYGGVGGIVADYTPSLAISNATISGNVGPMVGGVSVMGEETLLTLRGTTAITDNHAAVADAPENASEDFMEFITDEDAVAYLGGMAVAGGVYLSSGCVADIAGAVTVKDNTAGGKPSNLVLSASFSKTAYDDPYIRVSGALTGGDGSIGVTRIMEDYDTGDTTFAPGLVAKGTDTYTLTQADFDAFFPDDLGTRLVWEQEENAIYLEEFPHIITQQPTADNGYTVTTDPEGAAFQWYPVTREDTTLTDQNTGSEYSDYADGLWKAYSYQEDNYRADYFTANLTKGYTLTVTLTDPLPEGACLALWDSSSYDDLFFSPVTDHIYSLTIPADFTYDLYIYDLPYGTTKDTTPTFTAALSKVTVGGPVEGQTEAALRASADGAYLCHVTWPDGCEADSETVDYVVPPHAHSADLTCSATQGDQVTFAKALTTDSDGNLLVDGATAETLHDDYYILPAGAYYLAGDLNINKALRFQSTSTLCLNGHLIRGSNAYGCALDAYNADLTVCDCRKDVPHTVTSAVDNSEVTIRGGGFTGGTKTGNTYSSTVTGQDGAVRFYGGSIVGNQSEDSALSLLRCGGSWLEGVTVAHNKTTYATVTVEDNGAVTWKDGAIRDNHCTDASYAPGAIYVNSSATLTLSGNPDIQGSTVEGKGDERYTLTVYKLSNNHSTISLADDLAPGFTIPVRVYNEGYGLFTDQTALADGRENTFTAEGTGYFIERQETGLATVKLAITQQPTADNDYTVAVNNAPAASYQWYTAERKTEAVTDALAHPATADDVPGGANVVTDTAAYDADTRLWTPAYYIGDGGMVRAFYFTLPLQTGDVVTVTPAAAPGENVWSAELSLSDGGHCSLESGKTTYTLTATSDGVQTLELMALGDTPFTPALSATVEHVVLGEAVDGQTDAALTANETGAYACKVTWQGGTVLVSEAVEVVHEHTLTKTDAVAATCTEDGNSAYWTCAVCGKVYSDVEATTETTVAAVTLPATGHDLVKTKAVAATCTEDGNSAYWTCAVCGKVYSDVEATTETTVDDMTLPATGHDFTGRCLSDSEGHWHKCEACDTTDAKAAHVYDDDRDTTCNVCGYERTVEEPDPTYSTSGTVTDGADAPVSGAAVTLKQGSATVATATTGADGTYSFSGVSPGNYNVVAVKDGKTMTILVTLSGQNAADRNIVMPGENVNSVLEVKGSDTPAVVVGGLEKEAEASKQAGATVTVTMTVESKTVADAPNAGDIQAAAGEGATLDFLAITVEKTTETTDGGSTTAATETVTTTHDLLTVVIPFDFAGKTNVKVYRYHDGRVDELTARANGDGEKIALGTDSITLHVKNFSTYAVGYTEEASDPTPPSTPSGGGSSVRYHTLTASAGEGGSVTPSGQVSVRSGDSKTFVFTPDAGYEIADVLISGKSVGAVSSYTLRSVGQAHTVRVSFRKAGASPLSPDACPRDDSCPIHPFPDADAAAWYHDGVHYCLETGLMKGYGSGKFGPGDVLTRAMLAQILHNEAGENAVNGAGTFTDVAEDAWYAGAVLWAAEQGIVKGYGNGKFGPEDPITREQLALILWRCARGPAADEALTGFSDSAAVSSWALDALRWAAEKGIVTGKSGGILDPQGQATRAEAAAMLERFFRPGR